LEDYDVVVVVDDDDDDDDDEKDKMNCSGVCKVIIMCCIFYLEWSETRKCLTYCI